MSPRSADAGRGRVRALLFDLGGVLLELDFERMFVAWAGHSPLPVEQIRTRFTIDTAYERHERGELDGPGYLAHLRELLALDASDAEIVRGWNALFTGEIRETLELVRVARRQLPCFCFTNTNPIHQQAWSSRFPAVVGLFERMFVSSEIGMRKPDVAAFDAVARQIGADPAEILFFDDLDCNVEGARRCGMQAVRVEGPTDVRQALQRLGIASPAPG